MIFREATKNFLNVFDKNSKGFNITGIRAFFNDSYEVDDAQGEGDWTPKMFEEFEKLRGYNLKDHLPALFGKDAEEINKKVISDYRETISDLLLQKFTKPGEIGQKIIMLKFATKHTAHQQIF
ncbi:MAG: hypothetical protein H6613_02920 [Ignavibacteriales bacterium]|nr:hypothetical protein [Ignavibacteriales bacterium]